MANTRKTGSFHGKSNKLGHGGRASQLKAQGVPGGVIGKIAREKKAAPGQKNFHPAKSGGAIKPSLTPINTDRGVFRMKG